MGYAHVFSASILLRKTLKKINNFFLEAERKISTFDAQEFAKKCKMQQIVVSAKAGKNTGEIFANLASKILPRKQNKLKVEKEPDQFSQFFSKLSEAEKAALFEGIKLKFKQQ